MFAPFQRNPELRLKIRMDALRRVKRASADWETLAADNRKVASINCEARFREAMACEQHENDMLADRMTASDMQALAIEDEAAFREQPIVRSILEALGRMMSKPEAMRQGKLEVDGKKAGDYDGVPMLPRIGMAVASCPTK